MTLAFKYMFKLLNRLRIETFRFFNQTIYYSGVMETKV